MGLKDEHFFVIIPCFEAKCYWFIILWYTHNNLYLGADFIFLSVSGYILFGFYGYIQLCFYGYI